MNLEFGIFRSLIGLHILKKPKDAIKGDKQ